MTEAVALVLLKMLLAEAPGVVLAILRSAGLVGDDAGHAIDKMKRASDVLVVNPMVVARANRHPDPAQSDFFPPEYEKP